MTTDYRQTRQSGHLAMDAAEFNRCFAAVEEAFGQTWLETKGDHPLQILWQSRDALSVNQLCILGDAISGLKPIDSKWVRDHVKKIKEGPANNRGGSMFELVAVKMLHCGNQLAQPTKNDAPGYDAVLTLPDKAQIDVSLKSFGISTHETEFRKQAAKTEKEFIELIKAKFMPSALLSVFAKAYPTTADWEALRAALQNAVRATLTEIGIWSFKVADLPSSYGPYSPRHASYQVAIFAPFHANESKNLWSKFDTAFYNATQHAKDKTDTLRLVFMRVPEGISLVACERLAKDYLANNIDSPIDAVYLYQVTVADSDDGKSSFLSHAILAVLGRNYEAWANAKGGKRRGVQMSAIIGKITQPTRKIIRGGPVQTTFDEGYAYQRGNLYTVHDVSGNKPTNAHLRNLASGIFQHIVLRFPDGRFETIIGHFPELKEIALFS